MESRSVHIASQVDPALHSPAIFELLDVNLAQTLVEYTVDTVIEAVHCALLHGSGLSTYGRHLAREQFSAFVRSVLHKAEIQMPVVLVALCYIDRARRYLRIAVEEWATERVFLGALVLAYKYVNDSTLQNYHWAFCTGVFGSRDIGRVEREFLDVLDYDLSVTEKDILAHHCPIMSLIVGSQGSSCIQDLNEPQDCMFCQTIPLDSSDSSSDSDLDSDSYASDSSDSWGSPITPDSIFPTAATLSICSTL
ncbi:hypothetical protein ABKN59_008439 [Abortiporus biennis]